MGYFKPWRRKIGVVTLTLACVFMGIWLRNIVNPFLIEVPTNDGTYESANSSDGYLSGWAYWSNDQWQYLNIYIPHWLIVIPLTLLSAWLLLSKIHNPKPQIEPAPPKA